MKRMECVRKVLLGGGLALAGVLVAGCGKRVDAAFPFIDAEGKALVLMTRAKNAAAGGIALGKAADFEYSLESPAAVPKNMSLEITYNIEGMAGGGVIDAESKHAIVVSAREEDGGAKGASWILPLDFSFVNVAAPPPPVLRYRIPVNNSSIKSIHIKARAAKKNGMAARIQALRLVPRTFGFSRYDGGLELSPFVTNEQGYTVSVPEAYRHSGRTQVFTAGLAAGDVVRCDARGFEYVGTEAAGISIPSAFIGTNPYPVTSTGDPRALLVSESHPLRFPVEPRTADPYFVLYFPQVSWRDERYELFRWERFPSILIFDFATLAVQDAMLKRLAFFAEKKGFRGRLARDAEIEELHGWNAHDYSAETLAAFFNLVKKQNFPIHKEEEELRHILLANNVIRETENGQSVAAGEGAIISITRESNEYLRILFMAHEGFHGIFFIDKDFRDFCAERWKNLPRAAKNVMQS
ncbi:MAG: hypothetical protein LBC72_05445, partial [Spirochaetaceae bacterium]|nr:hypothetical protein [Spirochaetaceae bacterium]